MKGKVVIYKSDGTSQGTEVTYGDAEIRGITAIEVYQDTASPVKLTLHLELWKLIQEISVDPEQVTGKLSSNLKSSLNFVNQAIFV